MRTWTNMMAVLGLAVAVVACGDDGATSETAAPPPTTTTTTTTVSTAQLDAMLLDVSDVGAHWKADHEVTQEDLAAFTQLPCENSAINPTIAERLTADTGIQFEPTDGSYKHMIELLVTGDPGQLSHDLEILYGAYQACSATVATTSDTGALTVDELTLPELGDQRFAYVLSDLESPDSEMTWHVRLAMVRVGPIAVGLGLTEILPTPGTEPQISDEEFVQLLETAVAKVSG